MKVKNMVEHVLQNYPETRNSDKQLIMTVRWEFFQDAFKEVDGVWYIQADRIQDMPSPESIRRVRQKFQEPTDKYPTGKYPPTSETVIKKRRKNEKIMRGSRGNAVDILA